jgi:hypothetical protein
MPSSATISAAVTQPSRLTADGARLRWRAGAVILVVSSVVSATGAALHPRPDDLDNQPRELIPLMVKHNGIWAPAHFTIMVGAVIGITGLAFLMQSMQRTRVRLLSRFALGFAAFGQAFIVLYVTTDGIAAPKLAEDWAHAAVGEKAATFSAVMAVERVAEATEGLWLFASFGFGLALFGLAVARSGIYPKWFGLAILPVNLLSVVVGLFLVFSDLTALLLGLQTLVIALVLLWLAGAGVLLWRRADLIE